MAKILLEGRPGIGKTTLAWQVAERLREAQIQVKGFTTSEIRVAGRRRVGFGIEILGGESAVLAHVDFPGPPRVGRYGVDLAAFEGLVLPTLRTDSEGVWIIDELGKMELHSASFCDRFIELFIRADRLLATVHRYPHPFTDRLKRDPTAQLIRVTGQNRDRLVAELAAELGKSS